LSLIGPGCSSVGYGATQEIGPFLVDTDGKGLKFNNFSWNKGIRTTNITYISILCGTIHLTVFYGNVKKIPYIELLIDA